MTIQKILFGSPGTGKSYKIREIAEEELNIDFNDLSQISQNVVRTVFHPEYTYSDFMGKLLPLTNGNNNVIYKYYPGHFLQALGKAYRGLIDDNGEDYLLIIDELNRGNAAAIFGSIFQLLDRGSDDWSSYEINISEMEFIGLLLAMNYKVDILPDRIEVEGDRLERFLSDKHREMQAPYLINCLRKRVIAIPNNLSIIATINTSDESIYYLDSAFKRRWDWEYIQAPCKSNIDYNQVPEDISNVILSIDEPFDGSTNLHWYRCIVGINEFIKSHHQSIKRIEDKQLGWWFIKPKNGEITIQQVRDKVMFYLWDTVFARDKKPLLQLFTKELAIKKNLATYADFVYFTEEFLEYIHGSVPQLEPDNNEEDEEL